MIVKEICKRGHPQTEENSYYWKNTRSCLLCRRVIDKERNSKLENQIQSRNLRYQRLYGITYTEAEEMAMEQNNNCAICSTPCTFITSGRGAAGSFVLDHCHNTGVVRGLLCHRCNKVLGLVKDDPNLLFAMVKYLEKKE